MEINILLLIISILCSSVTLICAFSRKKINQVIDNENNKIQEKNRKLLIENEKLLNEKVQYEFDLKKVKRSIQEENDNFEKVQKIYNESLNSQKDLSEKAFQNYTKILEKQYEDAEEEYNTSLQLLKDSYANNQLDLLNELKNIQTELIKTKATRDAVIEAFRREREMEKDISSYCITLDFKDKADIKKLEEVKLSLNNPRILSMLIWKDFFQKPLKTLSTKIIGLEDKIGIYKITNIETKECYIGQSVHIITRWAEHVKCGLGIDTPANNKLYKAMQEYGIWNFSFELLEECDKKLLNEKEKYYIDLYNSCDLGYNSNKGVNK